MSVLAGKHVVLGVSGSIAAYKAVYLARLLVDAGAEVWPILTSAASRFVGPLSFSSLTGHRAVTDLWASAEAGEIGHVELAQRADVLVLAPATADLLARLASGRADDPLAAVALATHAPWVVAPAMESGMWDNPATRANVAVLTQRGAQIVPPTEGELASGRSGIGRLAEPESIFEAVCAACSPQDLAGERVLVTAGPTREHFDPARFVSNPSTGKMGYALARALRRRGAEVTLVSGPTGSLPPAGVTTVWVDTTEAMLEACRRHIGTSHILVMAAAPVDYRPAAYSPVKLKKQDAGSELALELNLTPDILLSLKARKNGCFVVGFAAESDDVVANAQRKLRDKDLDLVIANDISDPLAGFAVDTNHVFVVSADDVIELPTADKQVIAEQIVDAIVRHRGAAAREAR